MDVVPSQTQKPVIKAEGAGHSGPTFKPDNAEYGLLGRDPKGWGHLDAHLCYEPLIWPTKSHDSCLAARPNDRQRHSRTIKGRSQVVLLFHCAASLFAARIFYLSYVIYL